MVDIKCIYIYRWRRFIDEMTLKARSSIRGSHDSDGAAVFQGRRSSNRLPLFPVDLGVFAHPTPPIFSSPTAVYAVTQIFSLRWRKSKTFRWTPDRQKILLWTRKSIITLFSFPRIINFVPPLCLKFKVRPKFLCPLSS